MSCLCLCHLLSPAPPARCRCCCLLQLQIKRPAQGSAFKLLLLPHAFHPCLSVCLSPPPPGADVVYYYNRTQSEQLRERNRIQLIVGYNQWELPAEQARVDLYPSPIPHVDGSDFWSTRFRVGEGASSRLTPLLQIGRLVGICCLHAAMTSHSPQHAVPCHAVLHSAVLCCVRGPQATPTGSSLCADGQRCAVFCPAVLCCVPDPRGCLRAELCAD